MCKTVVIIETQRAILTGVVVPQILEGLQVKPAVEVNLKLNK